MSVTDEKITTLEDQALVASDQVRAAKNEIKVLVKRNQDLEAEVGARSKKIDEYDAMKEEVKGLTGQVERADKEVERLSRELYRESEVADAGRAVAASLKVLSA